MRKREHHNDKSMYIGCLSSIITLLVKKNSALSNIQRIRRGSRRTAQQYGGECTFFIKGSNVSTLIYNSIGHLWCRVFKLMRGANDSYNFEKIHIKVKKSLITKRDKKVIKKSKSNINQKSHKNVHFFRSNLPLRSVHERCIYS